MTENEVILRTYVESGTQYSRNIVTVIKFLGKVVFLLRTKMRKRPNLQMHLKQPRTKIWHNTSMVGVGKGNICIAGIWPYETMKAG